ncbi:hypothetical protein LLQ54_20090 [Rouxiella badensis]|uniref:hypothetical protein n=1 Tax=Rouxiella badensis TaxID=1646377 RepID=UPI001D15B0CB|nr:hypothetical protein [Rouxiella badensis]MCC3720533.1 hypothetical protein [Rouxiella badensis]MCC3730372.1 hypothetical protein [Rouxiella badensis]MCC3742177.1 hypothetical protein [Rouxiella badensis]
MKEIKYLKKTHDSHVGRIRTLSARDAEILVILGYAEYHCPKRAPSKANTKKGKGNA